MAAQVDFDVIVIGGGGAGMSAACEAAAADCSVMLVEAGSRLGGSTALSDGVFYAAGTSVQRAAGVEGDTAEAMYLYYMTLNQFKLDGSLARRLADEAAPGLEWLISLGVEFDPEALYVAGVDGIRRGHSATGYGAAIAEAIEGAVSQRSVEVSLQTRVRKLVVEDGAVRGIEVDGTRVTARAVVIATGGFGNNPEFLAQFYPQAAANGDWAWYIGNVHSRGDGIALGAAADADTIGHDRGLLLPTPGFVKELEVFSPPWLVYVNREGDRFVNETVEYAVLSGVIQEQTGGECFCVFDEDARAGAKPAAYVKKLIADGRAMTNWLPEPLAEAARARKIVTAQSLEELAAATGLRWPALQGTVDRYNAAVEAGHDHRFFKDMAEARPIATPPFYAARIRPAIVCLTSYGLRIDDQARVMGKDNRPIPGLYAAGEATGGVLGDRYCGGGNSIANAVVFGRAAGRSAAAQVRETTG